VTSSANHTFIFWLQALEKRHLAKLSFQEVRRGVQALSSLYVERRGRMNRGSVFDGEGKRAAFAFFFGPLHFLLVREIVQALKAEVPKGSAILDLGCGTGVSGAAWALSVGTAPRVIGVDRHSWVLQECKWTYQQLGIQGLTRAADLETIPIAGKTAAIAAFTINELAPGTRDRLRQELLKTSGSRPVLVIEPVARRLTSWWGEWVRDWLNMGGREDEWRFRVDLPEPLALMDRAAGLDHRELTARSLWLPGHPWGDRPAIHRIPAVAGRWAPR
jgi:hypothetical protein